MVILRPTQKLKALLATGRPAPSGSDTALGDWYVNRLVVDRQPLLILVSSTSLLPLLVPAREVQGLAGRLPALVKQRLVRLGIDAATVDAEIHAMSPVTVAPTVDRSVVGTMVDFASAVPYHLDPGAWSEMTLPATEDWLAQTPCRTSTREERVIFPDRKAPELLYAKWARPATVH
jgi:hypothetical protein